MTDVERATQTTPAGHAPLHAAQMAQPAKAVAESIFTVNQVVFPRDTNELGLATAGTILKLIDVTASLTASKHTGHKIVTASLDRMDFVNPARIWEVITARCFVTQTWSSSIEVCVAVDSENVYTGDKRFVAMGYLVFVALDDQTMKPTPVPPLRILLSDERTRALQADLRKASRQDEKAQLAHHAETEIIPEDQAETVFRTMTTNDANMNHNVFGGVILDLIHQAAEKAAFRHAAAPVSAVRQDRMSFEYPAFIGEEVKASAIVTRTWRTSMEVQVEVVAMDYKTREHRKVASSYLVYIAQGNDGTPEPVPAFTPQSDREKQRWQEAELRRTTRLEERADVASGKTPPPPAS